MQKPRKSEEHHNFFRTLQTLALALPHPLLAREILYLLQKRRKTRANKGSNSIEKVFSI
jgi:hypothetical protein